MAGNDLVLQRMRNAYIGRVVRGLPIPLGYPLGYAIPKNINTFSEAANFHIDDTRLIMVRLANMLLTLKPELGVNAANAQWTLNLPPVPAAGGEPALTAQVLQLNLQHNARINRRHNEWFDFVERFSLAIAEGHRGKRDLVAAYQVKPLTNENIANYLSSFSEVRINGAPVRKLI